MDSRPLVLVTGITGYLGSHVTLKLLQSGKYRVRGSVRNKDNPKKVQFISDMFGEHFDKIELVNADLLEPQSLKEAIKGGHSADCQAATTSSTWRLPSPNLPLKQT